MTDQWSINPIAKIYTDFSSKFGVPRQSGLVKSLSGVVVFEPDYRNAESIRGIEGFTHLWLIWGFSASVREGWSPTVRPPRLGGNTKMGVFATRSPFRPNSLALSVVKIDKVEFSSDRGPLLYVSGIDMMDQSPIFDIKPYIPYSDCMHDAKGGFTDQFVDTRLDVIFPEALKSLLPEEKQHAAIELLSLDPRPSYQDDCDRIYGVPFAGFDIRFRINGVVLEVIEVEKL